MTNCTDCRYQENMCKWPCDDCVKGDKWEEKPFTNADRIRAMTDEDLAKFIASVIHIATVIFRCGYEGCPLDGRSCWHTHCHCHSCWLDWLKQEVQE